ncbi:MAG: thrombospondin type 3 repeat-containing protein [Deltaproteobacteria bacterium]|nr:thrombospondin type 3 repeat-containing protein [Deltaproteobacteria bacterium]
MKRLSCLVLVGLISMIGASAKADVVYESATLGPTGQGGGYSVDSSQLLGVRFQTSHDWLITDVGGHLIAYGGPLFVAIVPLADMGSLPATTDLSDAIWATTFTGPNPSDEISIPAGILLPPGTWGIVFGSGLFGATGNGAMPSNNTDIGSPAYFYRNSSNWVNGGISRTRFFINGLNYADDDGDGWRVALGDCDDGNPHVHPMAFEACDGLDNDCNPATLDGSDEPWLGTACDGPDSDLCPEGVLYCSSAAPACSDASGDSLDVCDGADNDCDPATPDGSDEPLFGSACDGSDADLCKEGSFICNGTSIVCDDATGDTLDLCDGLDNDCDPTTPDGFAEIGFGADCDGPDADLCTEGQLVCDGSGLICNDLTSSSLDVCDGADNDCDPLTPDGSAEPLFGQACDGPDADHCKEGFFICDGTTIVCDDATGDALDLCDGLDNDCDPDTPDGFAEIGFGADCDGPDTDLCAEGQLVCDGSGLICNDLTSNSLDFCDGVDNDCDPDSPDGSAEPLFGQACDGPDTDRCAEGFFVCDGTSIVCDDATGDSVDICDGLDNDCDPDTADGSAEPGFGDACDGADSDACEEGQLVCDGSALICNDTTDGIEEACNGQDDDCDGLTDEGEPDTDSDGVMDACDPDDDGDGVLDADDNCPLVANADQTDTDGDGMGDACSQDTDGDGVLDAADNCPLLANTGQADNDGDGLGDACDPDDDDDEIADEDDNCPFEASDDLTDTDGDGAGDVCDPDDDADGVLDEADNCPLLASADQQDTDEDGLGNPCDPDDDDDEIVDENDNCPLTANPDQEDANENGVGDACEVSDDLDGDGVSDNVDNCPDDPNTGQVDTDGDGQGDECDPDDDGDEVADGEDVCPLVADPDQFDSDGDGLGNACDDDDDDDGVLDEDDNCPTTANADQSDKDADGAGDACDKAEGGCGCATGHESTDWLSMALLLLMLATRRGR